jgi:hypothetical protein
MVIKSQGHVSDGLALCRAAPGFAYDCQLRVMSLACPVLYADAVIGSVCSSDLVAASVIAAAAQVPVISAYASSSQLSGQPFFSRTVFTDRCVAATGVHRAC